MVAPTGGGCTAAEAQREIAACDGSFWIYTAAALAAKSTFLNVLSLISFKFPGRRMKESLQMNAYKPQQPSLTPAISQT